MTTEMQKVGATGTQVIQTGNQAPSAGRATMNVIGGVALYSLGQVGQAFESLTRRKFLGTTVTPTSKEMIQNGADLIRENIRHAAPVILGICAGAWSFFYLRSW